MDVRDAVGLAKKHIIDLFQAESVADLGLEEVEFDEKSQTWVVTVGFSRPWQRDNYSAILGREPSKRSYKVIRIGNADGAIISIKNREL